MNREDSFIHKIRERSVSNEKIIQGPGDDCAVLTTGKEGFFDLMTTDILVENVHFKSAWSSLKDIGYKAVTVNISDIIACGGLPETVYLSLAFPKELHDHQAGKIMEGIYEACSQYHCVLAGGDTSRSPGPLIINIAVQGTVKKEHLKLRSGAKKDDLVCMTGSPGEARAVLQYYEANNAPPRVSEKALQHFHRPEPAMKAAQTLAKIQQVTAMMDLSDGLLTDLPRMAESSGVAIDIFTENIPISDDLRKIAAKIESDPLTLAIEGGEDYGLLFTINEEGLSALRANLPIDFAQIGTVGTNVPGVKYFHEGKEFYPAGKGFSHF